VRILFFTDHFRPEPSAPAGHIHERAALWVRWGHEVTVVTSTPNFPDGVVHPGYGNPWRFVEDVDGIRVVRVKTLVRPNTGFVVRVLDYLSYMVSALVQALREPRPDVVISSSPHLFVAAAGWLYAAVRRVPRVLEVRDLWPASIVATGAMRPGRLYRLLERVELFLYRHATRVLVFTEAFRDDLVGRGVPPDEIDVVVNGANLDLFSPMPRDTHLARRLGLEDRFVVGYIGTIGLAQGLENLLDAAERVRDIPASFLVVGAGAARGDLVAEARRRGLDSVVWVPKQLREDLPAYWSLCDVSLVHLGPDPLFRTVIPSKTFESMAMGLPVLYVAPPGGEAWDLVEDRDVGITVPAADPAELAAAVRRLHGDPDLRRRLAANGSAAAPDYSRERQAKETLATLERAASGTP
jgi:colanic acid biosynthesis glycosyl transferase WcaI